MDEENQAPSPQAELPPSPQKTSWWRALWEKQLRRNEEQLFLTLTLVIGALAGLAVVGFILLSENLGARLYPPEGAAWRRLLVPVLGSLAMGYLLYRYFPDARGSGVPQSKAALYAFGGRITMRTVLGKFFCTAATLASGIPLGREGPSVQVGAGLASFLGRKLGLSREKVQALIPVGGSAAIAAAFNTPLAAVLFSLEELVGDLHAPVLGSVVLSATTSWMVLRLVLGDEPLFHVPAYQLVHPVEFLFYAVLGILGGFVSVAFVKMLLGMREWFLRQARWTAPFQPVAGGLLVGLLGLYAPQVLGVGYRYVGDALNGRMIFQVMALLVVFKLVTVTTAYASGNAGGIFGPALFIGAMLGGAVGSAAHHFWPAYTAEPGAYALVGMGAAFAGIVRAPMTSVIMIFEITRDYSIIVPLMIANLLSLFISRRFQAQPIYEELCRQDGIHLPSGETRTRGGRFLVHQAMRAPLAPLSAEMPVPQALERVRRGEFNTCLVAGSEGLLGIVPVAKLEEAAKMEPPRRLRDLVDPLRFPHVHSDQSFELAMERMGAAGLDFLPVVNRADVRKLEGVVVLEDILKAFGVR